MTKTIITHTHVADLGKPRIVVIGGGFAGLKIVSRLRDSGAQVVLFDKFNHHTFQPLLYQVATSGLETNSIVFPFRKRFAEYPDFFFRLGEVNNINSNENFIETSIGRIDYDYLVLATGARTNFYGLEEVEKNSLAMKTITDAIKVRNRIIRNMEFALLTDDREVMNSLMDFVIVGGGPTGVELSGALAELKNQVFPKDYPELELNKMDIHLIEAGSRLLNGMSKVASDKALEYLTHMGVKVYLNCSVKSYDGYTVEFNTGERLITRTMIWAAGVKGNPIEGLNPECIGKGNRLIVDQFNLVKGYKNIFAIGDVALMKGDEKYPNGHPMMAPPAIQQAKLLAKNLKRLISKKEMKPFTYFNKGSMATIGRNKAVVDLRGLQWQGFFAWLVWMFVHLISLVGFKNKFFVLISWISSYFSYDKSNRLIIGHPKEEI